MRKSNKTPRGADKRGKTADVPYRGENREEQMGTSGLGLPATTLASFPPARQPHLFSFV